MPTACLKTVDLHYLQLGQQTSQNSFPSDLVMVHGLAASLGFWSYAASVLAQTHPVTLFDLRGHGRSSMPQSGYTPWQMAEDLRELLDYLGIQKAHLLGHSFGGSVILQFAHRYPERVASLIFADVRLKLLQPEQKLCDWKHWQKFQPIFNKLGIELDENDSESGYQLLEEIAKLQLKIPEGKGFLHKLPSPFFGKAAKRTASRWLKLLETTTARHELSDSGNMTLNQLQQIQKPTLAIYGEYSQAIVSALALKQLWTHSHFECVPQAGHFFPISQPEKLIVPVQKFLSQTKTLESQESVVFSQVIIDSGVIDTPRLQLGEHN
ncbi:MAG: alpha/beta hydrolase [Microcoleus sp. SIO2G3]|nr:alpha/beta hydrolase [Microcoleus sp. SIO2G3]